MSRDREITELYSDLAKQGKEIEGEWYIFEKENGFRFIVEKGHEKEVEWYIANGYTISAIRIFRK